jgi:hypothetical protein
MLRMCSRVLRNSPLQVRHLACCSTCLHRLPCTGRLASVTQLYAFFYRPSPPLPVRDGWSIYSPRDEFGRMGVGSRSKAWRFTDINKDYAVGSTLFSEDRLSIAFSKFSSAPRIPPGWSSQRKSAILRYSMPRNTEVNVEYPS